MEAIDFHSEHITLEALQDELKVNPTLLEERRAGNSSDLPHAGNTLLMSSAQFGNVVVCEFLLSVGANVQAENQVCSSFFKWNHEKNLVYLVLVVGVDSCCCLFLCSMDALP